MDWIASISSVAGFVTAVAALLTVLEMKRQRNALYRPDLAIPSSKLFTYAGTFSNIGNTVHCSTTRYDLIADAPTSLPRLSLECFNIGLGAAKDVHVEWAFELDGVLTALNRLTQTHGISVEFGEYGFVLINPDGESLFTSRGSAATTIIPYVLPVQIQPTAQHIEIASEYAKAIAICASYYVAPHDQGWASIPTEFRPSLHVFPENDGVVPIVMPPATITLRYRDIAGNIHMRAFEVTPTFSHIQQLPRERDHIQEMREGQLRVFPAGVVTKLYRNRAASRVLRYFREVDPSESISS
jgi:hypothetical protein